MSSKLSKRRFIMFAFLCQMKYDLGSSISSKKSSDKKVNNFLEEAGGGLPLILVDYVSIVTKPFEGFYPIRPYMADIDLELKTF